MDKLHPELSVTGTIRLVETSMTIVTNNTQMCITQQIRTRESIFHNVTRFAGLMTYFCDIKANNYMKGIKYTIKEMPRPD